MISRRMQYGLHLFGGRNIAHLDLFDVPSFVCWITWNILHFLPPDLGLPPFLPGPWCCAFSCNWICRHQWVTRLFSIPSWAAEISNWNHAVESTSTSVSSEVTPIEFNDTYFQVSIHSIAPCIPVPVLTAPISYFMSKTILRAGKCDQQNYKLSYRHSLSPMLINHTIRDLAGATVGIWACHAFCPGVTSLKSKERDSLMIKRGKY